MKEICEEFDIKECTWKELRKKIVEILESYANILEGALQPTTLAELQEAGLVDKQILEKTHKKLMYYSRFGIVEGLKLNDKIFVIEFWKEWIEIKEDLIKVVESMKQSWILEKKEELDFAYLG